MSQTLSWIGTCILIEHVYEGFCHFSIKMYVPSQDSVRDMYMCMRVPVTILLRCMCQARTVFWWCICNIGRNAHTHIHDSNTVLAWHRHLNRRVAGTLIHISKPGQCSGHVYLNESSCSYSIKTHVPNQNSVRVMYMCMRVPATSLLRCLCQARTHSFTYTGLEHCPGLALTP
jgi:hypothetical protein